MTARAAGLAQGEMTQRKRAGAAVRGHGCAQRGGRARRGGGQAHGDQGGRRGGRPCDRERET
jgi:hypothetical protein